MNRALCIICNRLCKVTTNKKCLECNNFKICKKRNDEQDRFLCINCFECRHFHYIGLSEGAKISLNCMNDNLLGSLVFLCQKYNMKDA